MTETPRKDRHTNKTEETGTGGRVLAEMQRPKGGIPE